MEKNENVAENEVSTTTEETQSGHEHEHAHDHGHDHEHDHEHGHHHHDHEEEFVFEKDPVFDVDYKGECAYEVRVTVPFVNLLKQSEALFKELQGDAIIPGFRKGKVPLKLVQNKFSKAVHVDAAAKLVEESFKKLVKEQDLKPLAIPEVKDLDKQVAALGAEQDFCFTLDFEVIPKCELGPYRGIEVVKPLVLIKPEDIDNIIDRMRQSYAVFETVEDTAQEGDQALIDFEGKIDGEPFVGNSAENYPYIMGSGRFLKEFEAALQGSKTGDTVEADVTFPEDWRNEALANQVAHFVIKVNEVKRRTLPEVNDDLAKQAGFDTVADWRAKVEDQLKNDVGEHSDSLTRRDAMDKIIAGSTFELPKSLLEGMGKDIFEAMIERRRSYHQPVKDAEEEASLRADAAQQALREIHEWTVVREIAEAEGVEVTDEDFEKEANQLAERHGVNAEVALHWLNSDDRRGRTEMNMLQTKVIDVVLANATIVEKELKDDDEKVEEKA